MEQGPTLAAMLRGAGSMGNPQDVKRAAAKRWAKQGAVNGGVPDGSPGDAPGLPQHSGASGMLAGQLAAVPTRRAQPGGDGDNWKHHEWSLWTRARGKSLPPQLYPDGPGNFPDHARRGPYRGGGKKKRLPGPGNRHPKGGQPWPGQFNGSPYRRA